MWSASSRKSSYSRPVECWKIKRETKARWGAPQTQDLQDIVHPPDQEMESCENENELDWKPFRRLAHWDRRNRMEVIKGYTKQRQEKRLSVSKHVVLEEVSCLSTRITILNLGRRLQPCCATCLKGSSWKLHKIVRRVCCRSSCRMLLLLLRQQLFQFQQVPVGSASRLRGGTRPKRHAVLKFPFWADMLVPGQQRLTVFCVLRPHPV